MGANLLNASLFLINTLFQLYLWLVLLRVLLQAVRADFYHPVSQFVWRLTQPIAGPIGRVLPRWRRIDFAGLFLAYLVAYTYIQIVSGLLDLRLSAVPAFWYSALKVVVATLNLYTLTLVAQAFFSWLGPGVSNPAGSVLWSLNEPLLRPVRRFIPPLAGLDLSPLVVILALQFCNALIPIGGMFR